MRLETVHVFVVFSGALQLGHVVIGLEHIGAGGLVAALVGLLLFGLGHHVLHGGGEAFAAVDAFLGAVHHAAANPGSVIGERLAPVGADAAVDLGPVAVKIYGGEHYGLADPAEVDGAVVELRRHPDDSGLGNGEKLEMLGILAQPYVYLCVKIPEVFQVRAGENEVFVNGVVGMRHLHDQLLGDGGEVHVQLCRGHHGSAAEKTAGRRKAVPAVEFLRDRENQIVISTHLPYHLYLYFHFIFSHSSACRRRDGRG